MDKDRIADAAFDLLNDSGLVLPTDEVVASVAAALKCPHETVKAAVQSLIDEGWVRSKDDRVWVPAADELS